MKYISNFLRSFLIITLFSSIIFGETGSKNYDPAEETLKVIEDCMERSSNPWPDEWKKEYIDTIRKTIELHHDDSKYAVRLEILGKGFVTYWESLKNTPERSLFEVHQAQIRWYTEYLMSTEFPSEEERLKLRNQYKDVWDYATISLLKQFPFLDLKAVKNAKKDDLSVCYRKIDAPLMPVYLRPMTDEHVEKIKQRWDSLRYTRVNLWRKLVGDLTMPD